MNLKTNLPALLVLSLFSACIELPNKPADPYNPFDPDNPNYVEPTVSITSGPENNTIVTSDVITFQWTGNNENMQYRYALDNTDWSEYSTSNSVTLSNLDEATHQFSIQSRYPSLAEGDIFSRTFIVDAIQGPALYIYPKRKVISQQSQFVMELWLDESSNIAGLSTELIYVPAKLRVESVDFLETGDESVMLQNGGQLIAFQDIDNAAGRLRIDCAVVEGDPHNISGSGIVARITFWHLSGDDAAITLSTSSVLENSDGQLIAINQLVPSQLSVVP